MFGNRALIVVRVSKLDRTTGTYSPAVQRRQGERYARANGLDPLPDIAEDLSVSASIPPEKRAGLGPWLTDQFHRWDVMVVAMSDRISRDMRHSVKLDEWCEDNEKALFIVDYDLRMDYRPGADMVRTRKDKRDFLLRSSTAEEEHEKIKKRSLTIHEENRTLNVVNGGTPPYGYMLVPHPTREDGKQYGIVTEQKVIANRAADLLLNGMSWHEIADTLNAEGLPPAGRKGMTTKGVWHGVAVSRILKSQASMGLKMTSHEKRDGKPVPVIDDDGMAIRVGEPLFTEEKWIAIQTEIASRSVGAKTRTKNATPLLGVVYCGGCDRKLYRSFTTTKGTRYEYYKCFKRPDGPACKGHSFRVDSLYEALDESAAAFLSNLPEIKREFVKGEDATRELEGVRAGIAKLNDRYFADPAKFPGGDAEYERAMQRLGQQEAMLAARPQRADEFVETETGRTIADLYFATDDRMERRRLLLAQDIRMICSPSNHRLDIPTELWNRAIGKTVGDTEWTRPALRIVESA